MTQTEIQTFVETMEELGDVWTPDQVKDVYGDYTYETAINERKQEWALHQGNMAALVK